MRDWPWANFSPHEMRCKHTGKTGMDPSFMDRLQRLRDEFGGPLPVSSGYRHPDHPIEARKDEPGSHSTGKAADIRIHGADALRLVRLALQEGFTGVGIHQTGDHGSRFIHLDTVDPGPGRPRPWIWSY